MQRLAAVLCTRVAPALFVAATIAALAFRAPGEKPRPRAVG